MPLGKVEALLVTLRQIQLQKQVPLVPHPSLIRQAIDLLAFRVT